MSDEIDLLHGADEIAAFLLGNAKKRRQIYHLVASGVLPHFKLGATICARRKTLRAWIDQEEAASITTTH